MECFCNKLRASKYDEITRDEISLLIKAYTYLLHPDRSTRSNSGQPIVEAGRKRQVSSPGARARKRLRGLCPSDSSLEAATTSPVAELVNTYPCENALELQVDELSGDQEICSSDSVRLFIAIQKIDRNIEAESFIRRVWCYVFAQLHKKGTSVAMIVSEIENTLQRSNVGNIRKKVYEIRRTGAKWVDIITYFDSLVQSTPQRSTGLLCLLGSPSKWERAKPSVRESALKHLDSATDIRQRALEFTPRINSVVDRIKLGRSFVDGTGKVISPPQPTSQAWNYGHCDLQDKADYTQRDVRTMSQADDARRAAFISAISKHIPQSPGQYSKDTKILLTFLSFLSISNKVPLDLLRRGVTARKRWSVEGSIEESEADRNDLSQELCTLLSDASRLQSSFDELALLSVVSDNGDGTYTLDRSIPNTTAENLSLESISFWKHQALVVACRAIPWKYVESTTEQTKLLLPHLKHTLEAFEGYPARLSSYTKGDLALTLLQAFRLGGMEWKRFAMDQAKIASLALNNDNWYVNACIAESEILLHRIGKKEGEAPSSMSLAQPRRPMDSRENSAMGYLGIQASLDYIQVEDLANAERSLEKWKPLNENPSLFERVVMLRNHMILGRILRFKGDFKNSRNHLEKAKGIIEEYKELDFNKDRLDLTCDYADTLRELGELKLAESLLHEEITKPYVNRISGKSALELALAEVLFAQGQLEDAEEICADVESRGGLLKLERLRLYITVAKIRHSVLEKQRALEGWTKALEHVSKFRLTNGYTTRIITLSVLEVLPDTADAEAERSLDQVHLLGRHAKPEGTKYWIAGLGQWAQSRGFTGILDNPMPGTEEGEG